MFWLPQSTLARSGGWPYVAPSQPGQDGGSGRRVTLVAGGFVVVVVVAMEVVRREGSKLRVQSVTVEREWWVC